MSLEFRPFVSININVVAGIFFFLALIDAFLFLSLAFVCHFDKIALPKNIDVELRVICRYKCQLKAAPTIRHTKMSVISNKKRVIHVGTIYSDRITITVQ